MENKKIVKKVLDNGLTILVHQLKTIPKVSVQLWYHVGSKHEKSGQRGLAHFLEHMIFKGTKKLSESDIPLITNKLSGSCNAFTSQDYTGYTFDFPSSHWRYAFSMLSDCMDNCTFKKELFNAEIKAVIQELKMYKDDYEETLIEQLMSAIFSGHPYHHPIIGYKQDVWNLDRDALMQFYKKHYIPNNSTIIVVGDIEPNDVFENAEKEFGSIVADKTYKQKQFFCQNDVSSKSVVLYRDIQQPVLQYAFLIPGATEKPQRFTECIAWALCNGRGSRLYKKLVGTMKIATEVSAFVEDLFDCGLFFIRIYPKNKDVVAQIESVIEKEIEDIKSNGLQDHEFERARKKMLMEHLSLFEDYQELAYELGKQFVATRDENDFLNFMNFDIHKFKKECQIFFDRNFKFSFMHKGAIFPLSESEKKRWIKVQEIEDKKDSLVMKKLERTSAVEQGLEVNTIVAEKPIQFVYPKAQRVVLKNGLTLLFCNRGAVQTVQIVVDLQAKYYHDPEDLQGLGLFVSNMMLEGTKSYTASQFADVLESRGMSISIAPGLLSMSMLSSDVAFGLELLQEVLCTPTFNKESIEKVRQQMQSDLKEFWDMPTRFIIQYAREQIYKDHPFEKNQYGTKESLDRIVREDLIAYHKKYITPVDSNMAIVGDISDYDISDLVEKKIGLWSGKQIPDIIFPELVKPQQKVFDYPINRDQIVLCYAGLSVNRMHPEYENLLLFDQFFSGGASGSLSSRLFQLREETGLFYTIGGSVIAGASHQPGMILIKTIVSLDGLKESENVIERAIENATKNVSDQEFEDARNSVINALTENFESNMQAAFAFLFLQRYHLPSDYFDKRVESFLALNKNSIIKSVEKTLSVDSLIKLRAGRIV